MGAPGRGTRLFALAVSLAAAGACRGPRQDAGLSIAPQDVRAPDEAVYAGTLGAGDLVEVRVYQETDLSGPYRVSPDGTVDYPLCGKVKLAGMSQSQAADLLTQCLANG